MNLIIEASLCEPPSEISSFRDVALYGKTFIFEDIFLKCAPGTRGLYWDWLRRHGAHDFISHLLKESEKEGGFNISPRGGNLNVSTINSFNLNFIISCLNSLRV